MRNIVPELTPELSDHFGDPRRIASATPFKVKTFRKLVEHTAKLSFTNKDHLLFYRGQAKDYKNKAGNSTFYPSIYRGDNLLNREVINRFDILEGASKALVNLFEQHTIEGYKELKRRKSIQWSILQHYEVCQTPLLDFTQSLRVACSFATMDNKTESAHIFVFGLPYLTNRISINSEHDIINIRLLSICPPTALRPYFQEGYLVGTDDITTNYDTKTELDFKNRLIAKFEIPNNGDFWGNGFHRIPKPSLYPDNDPIFDLVQNIKELAERELQSGDIGEFLKAWAELEEKIVSGARSITQRNLSIREGIGILFKNEKIAVELLPMLEHLRKFRNTLVHTPKEIRPNDIRDNLYNLRELNKGLPKSF
jgi:hypothetical protein